MVLLLGRMAIPALALEAVIFEVSQQLPLGVVEVPRGLAGGKVNADDRSPAVFPRGIRGGVDEKV